jgi:hypothetical protein
VDVDTVEAEVVVDVVVVSFSEHPLRTNAQIIKTMKRAIATFLIAYLTLSVQGNALSAYLLS